MYRGVARIGFARASLCQKISRLFEYWRPKKIAKNWRKSTQKLACYVTFGRFMGMYWQDFLHPSIWYPLQVSVTNGVCNAWLQHYKMQKFDYSSAGGGFCGQINCAQLPIIFGKYNIYEVKKTWVDFSSSGNFFLNDCLSWIPYIQLCSKMKSRGVNDWWK